MLKRLILVAVVAALLFFGLQFAVKKMQGDGPAIGTTELRFTEVKLDCTHVGDLDASLPFMGMCAVDIDGDGVDEIFIGGGHEGEDGLFRFENDGFTPVAGFSGFDKDDKDATFGSASLDVTGDARAFLSGGAHKASWLQVRLPDGAAALNSRVQVTMADGRELTRQMFASESFASDQTDVVHFGLGAYQGTVKVTVKPSGGAKERVYQDVPVNQYFDAL